MNSEDKKKIRKMCEAIFGIQIGSVVKLKKDSDFINLQTHTFFSIHATIKGVVKGLRKLDGQDVAIVKYRKHGLVQTSLDSLTLFEEESE